MDKLSHLAYLNKDGALLTYFSLCCASVVRWPVAAVVWLTLGSACGPTIYRLLPDDGVNLNRMERLHTIQEGIRVEVTGFLRDGERKGTTAKLTLKIANTSNDGLLFDPSEVSVKVDETEFIACHHLVTGTLDPHHADARLKAQGPIAIGRQATEYISLSIERDCLPTLPRRLAVRFGVVRDVNPLQRLHFVRAFRVVHRGSEA
jgi:hypothetical protein